MPAPPSLQHYLLREHVLIPAVANFAINAGLAWATFRHLGSVPFWGQPSAATDLGATMFALPFALCLIATPLVKLAARKGKAPHLPASALQGSAQRLPDKLLLRALLLAMLASLASTPAILVGLTASGATAMSLTSFAWLKGILCGIMSAAVSPPVALKALGDLRREAGTPAA